VVRKVGGIDEGGTVVVSSFVGVVGIVDVNAELVSIDEGGTVVVFSFVVEICAVVEDTVEVIGTCVVVVR
jgi:hypothetical protein